MVLTFWKTAPFRLSSTRLLSRSRQNERFIWLMRETKYGFNFQEPGELIRATVWGGGGKLFVISYSEVCVCVFDLTGCVGTNKRRQIYNIAKGLEKERETENTQKMNGVKGQQSIQWKHLLRLSKTRTRNVCNKYLLGQTAAYSWSPNFQALRPLDLAFLYLTLLWSH
jgi:hypothetical protein